MYLSVDGTVDASDYLIGVFQNSGFTDYGGWWGSGWYMADIALPLDVEPGSYQIIVVVDYYDDVLESNESDNIFNASNYLGLYNVENPYLPNENFIWTEESAVMLAAAAYYIDCADEVAPYDSSNQSTIQPIYDMLKDGSKYENLRLVDRRQTDR